MQASSYNVVEIFDCVSDLKRSLIPPGVSSTSIRRVKWEIPPLQEYLADLIVKSNWNSLIELLLNQVSSPSLYSVLLARALFHSNIEAVKILLNLWPWEQLIVVGSPLLQMFSPGLSGASNPLRVTNAVNELTVVYVNLAKLGQLQTLRSVDVAACSVLNHDGVKELLKRGPPCKTSSKSHMRRKHYYLYIQYYNPLIVNNTKGDKYIAQDRRSFQSEWKVRDEVSLGRKSCLTVVSARGRVPLLQPYTEVNIHRSEEISSLRKLDLILEVNWEDGYLQSAFQGPLSQLSNIVCLRVTFTFAEGTDAFFLQLNSFQTGFKSLFMKTIDLLPMHISALSSSKHAASLTTLGLDECGGLEQKECSDQLLKLVKKLAPALEALYITNCSLKAPFVTKLFKTLEVCSRLVLLDISGNEDLDHHVMIDAANLGALPEFLLLSVTLPSSEIADEMNICQSLNDYRTKHSDTPYLRRVHVSTDLLENDDDNEWFDDDGEWEDDDDSDWEDYYDGWQGHHSDSSYDEDEMNFFGNMVMQFNYALNDLDLD